MDKIKGLWPINCINYTCNISISYNNSNNNNPVLGPYPGFTPSLMFVVAEFQPSKHIMISCFSILAIFCGINITKYLIVDLFSK